MKKYWCLDPPNLRWKFYSPYLRSEKKIAKVWHVGTQNLKLEMLITVQKSVFNLDHPSQRKCPICAKIQPFCSKGHFWSVLGHFLWLGWSKLKTDFCAVISISSFKFWVPTCHTLKKFFFGPQIGPGQILKWNLDTENVIGIQFWFFLVVCDT